VMGSLVELIGKGHCRGQNPLLPKACVDVIGCGPRFCALRPGFLATRRKFPTRGLSRHGPGVFRIPRLGEWTATVPRRLVVRPTVFAVEGVVF